MSYLPTLFPWQWWLLGIIPFAILLLYFLKLRREAVEVPSTFLWSQTIEDLHVNSLLQRLRRNILLLLQILAVLLAIFALLRPGIRGETTDNDRFVFLLDSSASMSATDVEDADNRFEKARELIRDRINTMTDYDEAMLISFSDRPIVLQSFTSDRGRLRDALSRAELSSRTTDILGALKAADGLANPKRTSEIGDVNDVQVADAMPAELLIYSDGGFQTVGQRTLSVGDDANPITLARWLDEVGYQKIGENERVTLRSQYSKTGDVLEVFSPSSEFPGPTRLTWSDNKIQSIEVVDVDTGRALDDKDAKKSAVTIEGVDIDQSPLSEFSLGNLTPRYIAMGTDSASNLGIVAFSAERNYDRPGEVQAFATVVNLGAKGAVATASLYVGDELYDSTSVELEPGEESGITFTLDSEEAAGLTLKLEGSGGRDWKDDFALDDQAFAGLSPLSNVSILVVTPGNKAIEYGLKTPSSAKICVVDVQFPNYLKTDEYKNRTQAGIDDLIIYDRCAPDVMPLTNSFFIGAIPKQDWSWESDMSSLFLIDVDRTHPLMRYVELYSLLIVGGRAVKGPAGTTELVGADVGPVLAIAPRDGYQDLVMGFELFSENESGAIEENTNWHYERSWPVFMFNILRFLAGAADSAGAPTFRPGETVRLRVESAVTDVTINRTDADPEKTQPGPSGVIEYVNTNQVGNYQVEASERVIDMFSINLFDRSESDIAAAANLDLGYEEITDASGVERRQEYWRWVLLAMLALIALEWWLYARRIA